MRKHNGKQLYGIQKILTTLKMGMNKELKKISIKQKFALNYVSKESKLTRIGDKIYTNTFTLYFPSLAYDRFLKGVIAVSSGKPFPVISLDHYKAEIHDKGRRTEGIFDYALNAIRLFQDEGFYVAVSFVPDKPLVSNRPEIFKVIDFFKKESRMAPEKRGNP